MRRAAVYCRVSTDLQANKGHSLDWQKSHLPKLAQASGSVVGPDDIYVEVMSGAKDDRPEYNRLMAAIIEGYYSEVWVVETSRLSRTEDRAEVQRVVDALQKFGCVIRTPGATFDLSTIEGEFIYDVDSAVNRMERKRIKARLTAGKAAKLQKGGYLGGSTPTGYIRKRGEDGKCRFEIDPVKSEMVKTIFRLCLQGARLPEIHNHLYESGWRSRNGTKITKRTILGILENPHYAGFTASGRRYNSTAKAKLLIDHNNFLEPLITREEYERAQGILDSRRTKQFSNSASPLTGILRCPNCNGDMMSIRDNVGARKYWCASGRRGKGVCSGDKPKLIPWGIAHQLVIDVLPSLIKQMENESNLKKYMKKPKADPTGPLKAQLATLERKIMNNILQQEDSYSTVRRDRIIQLENEKQEIETQIAAHAKVIPIKAPPKSEILMDALPLLNPSREEILRPLFEHIFVAVRWTRDSHRNSKKYRITTFDTTWGVRYEVHKGLHAYPRHE